MLTRACGLLPCITPPSRGHSHPSCRVHLHYVNVSNLFQSAVVNLKIGSQQQRYLGRLAVPGMINIRRAKGNMLLASHHGCEVHLEALFQQPFMSFQRGNMKPNLCGQETGFGRVRKRSSCPSH